ncbi:carbohydrate ABC transporter substrate-binding protein (CUT1 family) [Vagococcus fluvialis]|uniref:Sugar ABC transporter substrate-binding protein n=1 Tax=Vagococcus fluvialis TaxID=2738 RepID=A0A369ATH3_9ENTE|nr:sugar ABC transporter substrate-binding protein [Vagococcus fluvialis]RCX12672.1 carbohydrate ABC transporter substrate-binding protein (CUT1 family) [Vagococcus fluvialis]RSU01038.1 sugar ABC transporter substrate-binding protein [Vagococcus fluvialis]
MKKVALGLLTAGLAVGLVACGGDKKDAGKDFSIKDRYELDENTPAWKLDKKEEVTELTWYINADWKMAPFGEDATTKKIKEDLNIDVKYITGDDAKLNALISSGDMPDIVTLMQKDTPAGNKADKWAYSLNELADKYDPYLNKVVTEDTFNWFALSDGKTYGYPNYSNTQKDYDNNVIPANDAFVIREDVYNKLGKPSISTPEDFQKVMNDIKKEFPELTPFGFGPVKDDSYAFQRILQDFIGVPLETKEGSFNDRNLDPEYKEWLKTINNVYQDGNINDDSFTDDGDTYKGKLKNGQYAVVFSAGFNGSVGEFQDFKNNSGSQYIAIDGPQSTSGREIMLNQTGISGWLVNHISKSAKDPAKATQLFTYLISEEGQMLTKFGVEGETYKFNDDKKVEILPEVRELEKTNPEEYRKKYGLSAFNFFNNDRMNLLKQPEDSSVTQLQAWGKGKLVPHFIIENTAPEAGTKEARSEEAMKTKFDTAVISLIRAKSDDQFEKTYQEYTDFAEKNNAEDVYKAKTEKMKENKEKLGLKD